MNALDWSGNGNLADEALVITAIVGAIGTLARIRIGQKRIASQVESIDSNLNHVGEAEGADGPTIGQRVAKIDDRLDRVETNLNHRSDRLDDKVDRIAVGLSDLTARMMDHIADETKRADRVDQQLRDME